MQFYKGARIMTAQPTDSELKLAKHHLFNMIPVECKDFNRIKYYQMAFPLIQKLRSEDILPIVVGGTNYYLESLLYKAKTLQQDSY